MCSTPRALCQDPGSLDTSLHSQSDLGRVDILIPTLQVNKLLGSRKLEAPVHPKTAGPCRWRFSPGELTASSQRLRKETLSSWRATGRSAPGKEPETVQLDFLLKSVQGGLELLLTNDFL